MNKNPRSPQTAASESSLNHKSEQTLNLTDLMSFLVETTVCASLFNEIVLKLANRGLSDTGAKKTAVRTQQFISMIASLLFMV